MNLKETIKRITRVENQKRDILNNIKIALKEFAVSDFTNKEDRGWEAVLYIEHKMNQYYDENIAGEAYNSDENPEYTEIYSSIRNILKTMKAAYMDKNIKVFETAVFGILKIIYEVK